jgi:serine/threonine protein kinase/tetratricopeptide (TPR) repeat protein
MAADADRHFLFGLLALQVGLIDQAQLVAAFHAWTRDKARPLADHLQALGHLNLEQRGLIKALAAQHLKKHGGDAEKSLTAVGVGASVRRSLAAIGDPQINSTLVGLVLGPDGDDPERTASYSVGAPSSDGQRYRILRPHARGGLGAVFVALDEELHRDVALKQILDDHADEPGSRARFLAEAEITGGLEHPGVVPVYSLGADADGRPFYAMRFIRGDTLKEAANRFHADESLGHDPGRRSLELRKLLRQFVDVCNTIDYAHSRGVLHRDIKPANVIVGKYGETLVVDWGLAKAVGRIGPRMESGERTLIPSSGRGSAVTLPGRAMGTPAYMSPEQADGDLERLGAGSDVYSLGATLYYLLTGRPAAAGEIDEVLRAVREGDFLPPRRRDATIDPALDAVCLKAMARRPEDRYASPRALSEDVERWMADEPVSAWPEPIARRARRWANRNRTKVTAAAAAIVAGVIGLSAVLAVQTKANAALDAKNQALTAANARESEANAALRESNRQKDQANAALADANARVQARFELAREAIRAFQAGVTEEEMLKEDHLKPLRDKLLRSAVGFYQRLETLLQGQSDRPSRAILAESYAEVGGLIESIGIQTEALAAYRKAVAIRRELASGPAVDDAAQLELARALIALAGPASQTGDRSGALAAHQEARDLSAPLATGPRATASARVVLGSSYAGIGSTLPSLGRSAEALAAHRAALAIREDLARDDPAVTTYRRELARSHMSIGRLFSDTGGLDDANASYRRAQTILEELARENPAVTDYRLDLARIQLNIGSNLGRAGQASGALASSRRALAIFEELARENAAVTYYRGALGAIRLNIGHLLLDAGRPDEALAEEEQAQKIFEGLAEANPSVLDHRSYLTIALTNAGDVLRDLGRPAEARDRYARAIAVQEAMGQAQQTNPPLRSLLACSLRRLALVKGLTGDLAGASADTRRAVTLFEALPSRSGFEWFETAGAHATLSALAGRGGSGVPAAEGTSEADRAMAGLRRAVAMGYRESDEYGREPALDPLRGRDDFRLMMMDLAFPADPFAAAR